MTTATEHIESNEDCALYAGGGDGKRDDLAAN